MVTTADYGQRYTKSTNIYFKNLKIAAIGCYFTCDLFSSMFTRKLVCIMRLVVAKYMIYYISIVVVTTVTNVHGGTKSYPKINLIAYSKCFPNPEKV